MVKSLRNVAGLALLSSLADAKLYAIPEATTTFNFPLDQLDPQPTEAPTYADLKRRQSPAAITTVLVAPDNTCGYVSGRAGAAYTCATAASCIFFTASSTNPGRVACCNTQDCGVYRTCYDSVQISSSLCDNGCLVDQYTLKCTNTLRPYCNTISFSDSILGYWCNSLSLSTPQAAETTYEGETGRTWTPLPLTDDATSSVRIRPSGTPLISGSVVGPLPQPPVTSPSQPDNDEGSSTPVGAIVGGVIGGIAVIALVAFGVWFLLRKKKAAPSGQPLTTHQPMAMNPGPQGSPSQYAATTHTQSLYDPKVGGYPPSFGGTPPPQGGYQQPGPGGYPPAPAGYFANSTMVPPDRADTTSPGAVSAVTHDHRLSMQPTSPNAAGGFQQHGQQQPMIHEAPATNDGHKGHMHELA
ncbi:hypothetical protein CCHL11_01597 [Colletotrichum chlorophyti]|uniref:Uncharacterized protein n=1 Tax=Colletotrichum chlorophyti TaxID=708187 RepID=A0A1Q8RYN8_9PEZI|nr:hypothetical protein CCHL11_01597 [Colletotrichum chlorophyti]